MLNIPEIFRIAQETNISPATIGQIIELILSKMKHLEEVSWESLKILLKKFISNMKTPQKLYSIRIKLDTKSDWSKITTIHELSNDFSNQYTSGISDPQIPNLYYFLVKGPLDLKLHNSKVYLDRFAAESVMIGANLYIPGIINNQNMFHENEYVSMYGPNNVHVGNGITKIDSKDLSQNRKGLVIETKDSLYQLPPYRTSDLYNNGLISDQVFSSLIACWTLMSQYTQDAQILDMCSAPGHKTCALSEIGYFLNNGIHPNIISVDRSSNRLGTLREDLNRLKLKNITIIPSKIQKLEEKYHELIDANDLVVLDPPCSALGTRPKITVEHSWNDYRNFFLTQRSFLKIIDRFVKSGGFILYNTCTLTLLENEGIISYAKDKLGYKLISVKEQIDKLFPNRFNDEIKNNVDFGNELYQGISRNPSINEFLVQFNGSLPSLNSFNFENLTDLEKYHTLSDDDCKKVCRTYLDDIKTTGYFFALLQKK